MRTPIAFAAGLLLIFGAAAAADDAQPAETVAGPKIAVISFDSDAISNDWYWSCCKRRWAAGAGIADMVARELKRQSRGRGPQTVDRGALHQLLINQRLHDQDDLSTSTAARIARELGADLAVLGHTHVFEALDVGVFIDRDEDFAQARVILAAKVIDARSGVVVGEESTTAYRVRPVPPWDIGDRPRTDIGGARFRNSFLGRTARDAARSLAGEIRGNVRRLTASGAWVSHEGPAVVDSGGGEVTINAGSEAGIAVGDAFRIVRMTEDGASQIKLGTMAVAEVEARLATGRIDRPEDAPAPRPGDLAVQLDGSVSRGA